MLSIQARILQSKCRVLCRQRMILPFETTRNLAAFSPSLLCDVQNKIRVQGPLREQILSLLPLTRLGYLAQDSSPSEKTIWEGTPQETIYLYQPVHSQGLA